MLNLVNDGIILYFDSHSQRLKVCVRFLNVFVLFRFLGTPFNFFTEFFSSSRYRI